MPIADGDGAGTGTSVPAPSRRTWLQDVAGAARRPESAPDCTSMSSSRILSLWARAWCPQKSSSPPEGRTARTFAAAPQRSQRSATVSSGRERVPGCTAVSLRLDTGVAPVSLDATNRLRGTSTLPDARHPGAIPGARRDTRHVVTMWRSGHLCGDRPGVVRPSDSVDYKEMMGPLDVTPQGETRKRWLRLVTTVSDHARRSSPDPRTRSLRARRRCRCTSARRWRSGCSTGSHRPRSPSCALIGAAAVLLAWRRPPGAAWRGGGCCAALASAWPRA